MQSVAQELEQKTQAYWGLCRVWNGIDSKFITVGVAIEKCSTIMQNTNGARPIWYRAKQLQDMLVQDKVVKHPDSELIEFPDIVNV